MALQPVRALERWGAFMLKPQATVAALPADEGQRDGLWLGLLYVLGSQLISVGQAIKSVLVVMSPGALVTLASQAGRILLPPLVLMLIVEFLVGPSRSYRSGLYLLPLVICATGANLMRQMGSPMGNELSPLLVGALWSVVLVLLSRRSIPVIEGGSSTQEAS